MFAVKAQPVGVILPQKGKTKVKPSAATLSHIAYSRSSRILCNTNGIPTDTSW